MQSQFHSSQSSPHCISDCLIHFYIHQHEPNPADRKHGHWRSNPQPCSCSRAQSRSIARLRNTTLIEKLHLLSPIYAAGMFLKRLLQGTSGEEKHVGGMKQQQPHPHPPGPRAHPPEFTSFYPYPQSIPAPAQVLFLKMLVEEASTAATAAELL